MLPLKRPGAYLLTVDSIDIIGCFFWVTIDELCYRLTMSSQVVKELRAASMSNVGLICKKKFIALSSLYGSNDIPSETASTAPICFSFLGENDVHSICS